MKPLTQSELSVASELLPEEVLPLRVERRLVELNAYAIRENKSIVDVKVIDLSYDGCAVRTLTPFKMGERLRLSVLGRGALNAVVRWHRSRHAGLLFLPDNENRAPRIRQAERIEVRGEVTLRRASRRGFKVTIFDITRFGCKCEFVDRPRIYERVWVKFDGVEALESVVCWLEESTAGLMFVHPFHPAVFAMLLDHLRPV